MITLKDLAATLGLPFTGDPALPISGPADAEALAEGDAPDKGRIYFVETPAFLKRRPRLVEGAPVLTIASLAPKFANAIVAPDAAARPALIALLKRFDTAPRPAPGVSPAAFVHPTAKVAASASILPGAVILEGAVIGERAVVHAGAVVEQFAVLGEGSALGPNSVLGHRCVIGRECVIHGCTVIGADGFGFYDGPTGRHKVPQIGNVVIGDHVEIGASCTVDRATIESTTIGDHTKFDDQVHVGHNCRIGRYIYIVGNSALGGSVTAEDGVMISGMCIIKPQTLLKAGTVVMGFSAIAQDTEAKTAYFGSPARPAREMHKMNASLAKLPELLVKFRELEAEVARLKTPA
ncbi:MAG: UDP-3-O-(3-hydroxymyristoyl)glucosamine N-acyltransferase [Elusimicrobiota bacterium]|nr:MAG: UDP-3-O-(3-hydroxymyristoyl)glucosamine N-acyltransferase [Elusimicrobiota bacterium]